MVSVVGVVLQLLLEVVVMASLLFFSTTSSEITHLRLILQTNSSKGSAAFANVSSTCQQMAKKAQRPYQFAPTRPR
jgi:hypothetical protein